MSAAAVQPPNSSYCDNLLKSRTAALDRAAEAYDIDEEARWLFGGLGVFV